MTDQELLEGFEECSPTIEFHHSDHVRVVWLYLHRYSLYHVLALFPESLKRFAISRGRPDLYHETITWAYIFLIHERIARTGLVAWDEFVSKNTDLFNWNESILKSYYTSEVLQSDLARRVFLFPDRLTNRP